MHTLDSEEMASMIRREFEFRGWTPPNGLPMSDFEAILQTFHRKYLEELMLAMGITADQLKG